MTLAVYEDYAETLEALDDEMRFEFLLDIAKKKRKEPSRKRRWTTRI